MMMASTSAEPESRSSTQAWQIPDPDEVQREQDSAVSSALPDTLESTHDFTYIDGDLGAVTFAWPTKASYSLAYKMLHTPEKVSSVWKQTFAVVPGKCHQCDSRMNTRVLKMHDQMEYLGQQLDEPVFFVPCQGCQNYDYLTLERLTTFLEQKRMNDIGARMHAAQTGHGFLNWTVSKSSRKLCWRYHR